MRGVVLKVADVVATVVIAVLALPMTGSWHAKAQDGVPIVERHVDVSRGRATERPRSEGDQAVVDGWPLYRTERGQAAFNAAMATLAATDFKPPVAAAFKGCTDLDCELELPRIGADGWIPAGRLWVSPSEYVLIAHSPRPRSRSFSRGRSSGGSSLMVRWYAGRSAVSMQPFLVATSAAIQQPAARAGLRYTIRSARASVTGMPSWCHLPQTSPMK